MKAISVVLLIVTIVAIGVNISVYTTMAKELNILVNEVDAVSRKCINLTKIVE